MADLKSLGIAGSLRRQSRNAGLLRSAWAQLPAGVAMDVADIPFFNADIEAVGRPAPVALMARAAAWAASGRNITYARSASFST